MDRTRFCLIAAVALTMAAPLAMLRAQEGSTGLSFDAASVSMLKAAMHERIAVSHTKSGATIPAYHCRHAKEGCDRRLTEFAQYVVDAGQTYGMIRT